MVLTLRGFSYYQNKSKYEGNEIEGEWQREWEEGKGESSANHSVIPR